MSEVALACYVCLLEGCDTPAVTQVSGTVVCMEHLRNVDNSRVLVGVTGRAAGV